MAKMWAGRTAGVTDPVADDFNSSIAVDQRMAEQDITGSMAHAKMLAAQGILDAGEVEKEQRVDCQDEPAPALPPWTQEPYVQQRQRREI